MPTKGGENRKTSGSIKQKDNTKSAQFISNKQIFNVPMLCANDKLQEVRHVDQDFMGLIDALGQVHRGVSCGRLC